MAYNIMLAKEMNATAAPTTYAVRGSHIVFLAALVEALAGSFIAAVALSVIALMVTGWEDRRSTENSF